MMYAIETDIVAVGWKRTPMVVKRDASVTIDLVNVDVQSIWHFDVSA